MTSAPVPNLEEFLLPPPASTVVSVLLVLGLLQLGRRLARRLGGSEAPAVEIAGGFVVVAGLTGSLIHGLVLARASTAGLLRVLAALVMLIGVHEGVTRSRAAAATVRGWWLRSWSAQDRWGRLGLVIAAVIVGCLLMAALGPATDADSLNVHLAIPLEWLRRGGLFPREDWLHMRVVGIGEAINLLGLAVGTDGLGALLQWAGLVIAIVALTAVAVDPQSEGLGVLLVAALPLTLFLVPNQKPQLLPAAATTLALVLVVTRRSSMTRGILALAFGSLAVAASSKYSFLPSSALVAFLSLVLAWRHGFLRAAIGIGVVAFVLIGPLSILVRNTVLYGDPVSPLLERFRARPDPVVIVFAEYLREFGPSTSRGIVAFLRALLGLLLPLSAGSASTALGAGALAFLFASPRNRLSLAFLFAGAASASLTFAGAVFSAGGANIAPRYLLEPYFWFAAAVVSSPWTRGKDFLRKILIVQAIPVALAAAWGGFALGQGALAPSFRASVMRDRAALYVESEWVNSVLPPDAVVVAPAIMRSLVARDVVLDDPGAYGARLPHWDRVRRSCGLLRSRRVSAMVVDPDRPPEVLSRVLSARPMTLPTPFRTATRNPWNSGVEYRLQVFDVSLGCE